MNGVKLGAQITTQNLNLRLTYFPSFLLLSYTLYHSPLAFPEFEFPFLKLFASLSPLLELFVNQNKFFLKIILGLLTMKTFISLVNSSAVPYKFESFSTTFDFMPFEPSSFSTNAKVSTFGIDFTYSYTSLS